LSISIYGQVSPLVSTEYRDSISQTFDRSNVQSDIVLHHIVAINLYSKNYGSPGIIAHSFCDSVALNCIQTILELYV